MNRTRRQNGFILMPVVFAIVLIATIAFMLNNQSAINVDETGDMLAAEQVENIAHAALAHATWGAQNSGCAGDMSMTTVPFGQASTGSYTAAVTTPGGATTAYPNLAVDQDAWFRSDNPTSNSGTTADMHLRMESGNLEYALYRFDLSSLPAGSQINSATAWLYVATGGPGGGVFPEGPLTVHRVTADWTETGATWDTMNTNYDSAVIAIIPAQSLDGVWVQINLTAQVQAWVNGGEANYGIMLIPTTEGTHGKLASREAIAGQQPRLDVIVGTGPASPMTITATGTLNGNPSPANDITRTLTHSLVPAYQSASNLVLQPDAATGKDAYIWEWTKNSNYGTDDETWVSLASNSTSRSLFMFDLAEVPVGAKILSATLSLHHESGNNVNVPISAHRISNPWDEAFVTWNLRDNGINWDTAGGDFDAAVISTTAVGPASNVRYEWDITNLVQGWTDSDYPNYGVALATARSNSIGERFYTSDEITVTRRPRLTVQYACECGSACMAPQGSGTVMMVVVDPTNLVPTDAYRKALFESWGYTVNVMGENANAAAYATAATSNDVFYISESVNSAQVGVRIKDVPIGVVSQDGSYNADLGFAGSSAWTVASAINVTDTSHYITAVFPTGPLDIYSAGMEQLTTAGGDATGLQTLADTGGAGSLVVLDVGAIMDGGGTAAGRRVMLPLGRVGKFNWDYLNGNGRLIVQRALQWGASVVCASGNAGDDFESGGYAGSPGSIAWTADWQETGESDGAGGGDFSVVTNSYCASGDCLQIREDRAQSRQLHREIDIASAVSASLSFKYRRRVVSSPVGGEITLEVSGDGGASFMPVKVYNISATDAAQLTESIDITPYIGNNTQIRFSTSNTLYETAMYVDDIDIAASCLPAPAPTYNVLLVVGNGTSPAAGDIARKALMESWGYTVNVIDDGTAQADLQTAALAADVTYVTSTIGGGTLADKLTGVAAPIVNEFPGKLDNFGFASSTSTTVTDSGFAATEPSHYITEPFGGSAVTVFNSSLSMPVPGGTLAAGMDMVAFVVSGSKMVTVATLDTGAIRWDGNPAPARRAHLPFANADTTNLTVDGQTILQRTLEWAAGAGAGAGTPGLTLPIAHWKLDETSGTTAVDSVGGHDGTLINFSGSTWVTGQLDGALDLDGINDEISVPHHDALSLADAFTLMTWIRPDTISFGYQAVMFKGNSGDFNWWFGLQNGELLLEFYAGGSLQKFSTSGAGLMAGNWYHIAASFDNAADTVALYIDGVRVHTLSTTATPDLNTGGLIIGNSTYPGEEWDGLLDDVRIYDRALTDAEIADIGSGGGGGGGSPPTTGVVFEEFTDAKLSSNGTSLSIDKPAGTVAGDLLIAAVATDGNNTSSLTPPAGWSLINVADRVNEVTFGVWWKLAGASESNSYTFTWSTSEQAYGWIMRFTGHDAASPIDANSNETGSTATPSSPSVTTTVDNALILRLGGFDDDDITVGSPGLSGHTAINMDKSGTGNFSNSGGSGYMTQAVAGASDSANFTLTKIEGYVTVTIAIAPAP